MTVGGTIWHVKEEPDGRLVLVNGTGCENRDWLCIKIVPGDEPLKKGDQIWWQGRKAFWTPEPRNGHEDVAIARVGYSWSIPQEMRHLMNESRAASSH
jgi:hypothetical protein